MVLVHQQPSEYFHFYPHHPGAHSAVQEGTSEASRGSCCKHNPAVADVWGLGKHQAHHGVVDGLAVSYEVIRGADRG
jgi:hypothetical protein